MISRLLCAGTVLVASVAGLATEVHAAAKGLRFAARDIDYGSALSPAGEYAAVLGKPDSFPPERRLVIKGVVVGPDGKPVAGTVVYLFPLDDKGPDLVLGFAGGTVGPGNPKGTTDASGRFTITTGPLWEFTDAALVGLLLHRSPDRPFDLGVLAVENAAGALRLALSEKQRSFDLGPIRLEVSSPKP